MTQRWAALSERAVYSEHTESCFPMQNDAALSTQCTADTQRAAALRGMVQHKEVWQMGLKEGCCLKQYYDAALRGVLV